jgi:FkbM family methyltransferase
MTSLLKRITEGAGRRVVDSAASSSWIQQRAWELITARRTSSDCAARELLAFCAAQRMHSNAQLCQDLWVLWETGCKRNGYFVEFGATNGVTLSNTCLLEKAYGWNGILAEPFAVWHNDLAMNRSARIDHRCVWRQTGEQLEFIETPANPEYAGLRARAFDGEYGTARGAVGQSTVVKTVSLNDLLREHDAPAHIDYLSIDTEGSELDILEAFEFSRYRVDLISVEHAFNDAKREALRVLLVRNDFVRRFEAFSRWDDWYVNRALLEERRPLQPVP